MSETLLSWAAALPRFQGGPIAELQVIREHQQKDAERDYQEALVPEGYGIELKRITLSFFYEFEEQVSVNRLLKRQLDSSPFSSGHFEDIEKSASRLEAARWSNLGGIYRKGAGYLPLGISVESMPECVELLHLSHLQIMSSISCLEVTIRLSDKAAAKFDRIAKKRYLPEVLLNEVVRGFFGRMGFGRSSSGKNVAEEKVALYIQDISNDVEAWLLNFFKFKSGQIRLASVCPIYLLERPESCRQTELLEFAKENWKWLAKYGFQPHGIDTYANARTLYSPARNGPHIESLNAIFVVNEDEEDHFHLHLEMLTRGFATASAVYAFLRETRENVEALRYKILMRLRRRKPVLASFSRTTLALRRTLSRVRHVSSEFKRNKWWFQHSLEGFGELEIRYRDESTTYEKNSVRSVEAELANLSEAAELVDRSISEQLEIENIAAMFGLQRRIFWLTLVAAFAGIVGVVSVWDKLVKAWCELSAFIA